MIIEITKKYIHTPFAVRTEPVKNAPGTWDSTKISIFRDGNPIGEYLRNYNSFGANTFHPFEINHEWYALYSDNYTSTRVMKLHHDHIEDWCGEEAASHGFCPVEFYIPRYIHTQRTFKDTVMNKSTTYDSYTVDCDVKPEEFNPESVGGDFVSMNYTDFGFMCGCVWGDDSSWKLRYIDLTQVPDKILTITDKFGYWELPDTLTLRESVNMSGWQPGHDWITLYKAETINLKTNERG